MNLWPTWPVETARDYKKSLAQLAFQAKNFQACKLEFGAYLIAKRVQLSSIHGSHASRIFVQASKMADGLKVRDNS